MFKQISDGVINVVKGSSLGPLLKQCAPLSKLTAMKISEFAIMAPGVFIGIDEGEVVPVGQMFECRPHLFVYCLAQDFGQEAAKREKQYVGSWAMVLTCAGLLWNSTLGIQDPAGSGVPGIRELKPLRIGYEENELLLKNKFSLQYIELETAFTLRPPDEGAPTYIDKIGLDYFLVPERDMTNPETPPDASDLLTV